MALADPASVLIVEAVEDVVAAVFDDPMPAIDGDDLGWAGHLSWAAGDAVGEFPADLAGFLVIALALDEEGLLDVGKVEVVVDVGGHPNPTGLDAAVERR